MGRALRLAEFGLNSTSPNPRVGCVIVRDGQVVGEGWHRVAGESHAEIHALRMAGARARGATVYVTLEPCSHHGRTPPCAEALVSAGVGRVVAAMPDPNPQVSGRGLQRLADAGIRVDSGLLEAEARELNLGFVSRMTRGRPWVRAKLAASLDGKTALDNGASQWITGEAARHDGHRWRARACAILCGMGTVMADDPQLSVRGIDTVRQPLKVIVDRQLELPLTARLLDDGRTLVATASADTLRAENVRVRGAQVFNCRLANGRVDLAALLSELGRREMNEVHVEGGPRLNGALLEAGLIDEILLYVAPSLLGDRARGLFDLPALTSLAGKKSLVFHDVRTVGADLRIVARVVPS